MSKVTETVDYRKKYPWCASYSRAKQRCINTKLSSYKYYGGRGIKMLMSVEDFKFLWFRDKAWLLKQPSIDRKDNDKNYTLGNCRYIEMKENCRLSQLNSSTVKKPVSQYDLEGNFIKTHSSITEAAKSINGKVVSLSTVLHRKNKAFSGYKWSFAKKEKTNVNK